MKKLTKIKLINWHIYNDIEISIRDNSVICGENGSGKSTLIDAILFVISGGTAKFNTAANEKNNRNVESYVRGKLAFENKEYLRNNDVISHIALEFFDDYDKSFLVLGSVISANVGAKIEKSFYQVNNSTIESENYYSNNKKIPSTLEELKRKYSYKEFNMIEGNIDRIKRSILRILNIYADEDCKYLELLSKALAFKPIGDIDKFAFDYLLPKHTLSLESMKETVRRYRDLEHLINLENDKLESLAPIYNEGLTFETLNKDLDFLNVLKEEKELDINKSELSKYKANLDNIENSIKTNKQTKKNILEEIKTNEKTIISLENNDIYKRIKELEDDKLKLHYELKNYNSSLDNIESLISQLNILLKIVELNSYIDESFYAKNFLEYKKDLENLKSDVKLKFDWIKDEQITNQNNLKDINIKLNYKKEELNDLLKGVVEPSDTTRLLKKVIGDHFFEKYHKNIEINSFYDLVELNDERYRNALEGFLNTRKEYLFIEGKYYDEALKVYDEESKNNKKLYGAGIVNVNALNKDLIPLENSLATKLDYKNDDAKLYASYILGNIICVENVDELKKYESSITPTCMLYQGKVARKINPKFYEKYYLGRTSIQFNITRLENEIENLEEDKKYYEKNLNEVKYKLNSLEKIHYEIVPYLEMKDDLFTLSKNLELKIKNLDIEIKKYNDSDIIEIQNNISKLKNKNDSLENNKLQLEKEIENLIGEKAIINESYNNIYNIINESESKIEIFNYNNEYILLKNKYLNTNLDDFILKLQEKEDIKDKKRLIITNSMKEYVKNFNFDVDPVIDNLNLFISLFNDIEKRELVRYKNDVVKVKKECDDAFKNDYINKIRDNIKKETLNIRLLNNALKNKPFGNEKEVYEFIIKPSKNDELKKYYELFTSNEDYSFDRPSLLSEEISETNKQLIDDLFEKLNTYDDSYTSEKELEKFTDYREFMSYDIKITDKNNNVTYFSQAGKGKSGGETQTPFYVFIAASFEQIVSKAKNFKSPTCLVFLDEAFNNMDDSRIQTMMDFYKVLNIQLMISVPTQRAGSILKYCDTGLSITKKNNQAYVYEINKEDL